MVDFFPSSKEKVSALENFALNLKYSSKGFKSELFYNYFDENFLTQPHYY